MKNCLAAVGCNYRTTGSLGAGCSYQGQCTHQVPQESLITFHASNGNEEIVPLLKEIIGLLVQFKNKRA